VFDDIVVEKIDSSPLHYENETLGQGEFGKVEKIKYLKVIYTVNMHVRCVCMYVLTM